MASVSILNSTISGSVVASRPHAVTLCGDTVKQAVIITDATSSVLIGDPSIGCAGNTTAALVLQGNTGREDVHGNTIAGRFVH